MSPQQGSECTRKEENPLHFDNGKCILGLIDLFPIFANSVVQLSEKSSICYKMNEKIGIGFGFGMAIMCMAFVSLFLYWFGLGILFLLLFYIIAPIVVFTEI